MNKYFAVGSCLVALLVVYACAEVNAPSSSSRPIMIYVEGDHKVTARPGSEIYAQIYSIVGGDGILSVSVEKWEEVDALLKTVYGDTSVEDEERLARWKERLEHWANVEAFADSIGAISKDRVIDREESARICFLQPQWEMQLTAAQEYVEEYRRIEPEFVARTPDLGMLEEEAKRGLALMSEVECR